MAYLDIRARTIVDARAPIPPGIADFSAIEWRVIGIARREGALAVRPPSRWRSLLATIGGWDLPAPLADPKLEALRRAAAVLWHCRRILDRGEVDALMGAGFSFAQVALLGSVCGK